MLFSVQSENLFGSRSKLKDVDRPTAEQKRGFRGWEETPAVSSKLVVNSSVPLIFDPRLPEPACSARLSQPDDERGSDCGLDENPDLGWGTASPEELNRGIGTRLPEVAVATFVSRGFHLFSPSSATSTEKHLWRGIENTIKNCEGENSDTENIIKISEGLIP
ncbi:hypothetical protein RRG08_012699 [Elysia crispata]|uniref:Uncharacterized protein n=1 Tax=Elysia crispata TaxID=231223 RepID=A0AAE1ADJ6_9GAST|nr:hypothetical protein RRG08_012699 [Elysia crispata]